MELFHVIADPACAEVRRKIVEWDIKEEIDFRNIDASESARKELTKALGRPTVPTLKVEDSLITGKQAILEYLEAMAKDPAFILYPKFDGIAREVWSDVKKLFPKEIKAQAERIQIFIEDEPSGDILEELPEDSREHPDEVCGLHVGVPITHESVMLPTWAAPRVYLFRFAILDLLDPGDPDGIPNLKYEIAVTLLHELGHHFGLTEADLERLGYS